MDDDFEDAFQDELEALEDLESGIYLLMQIYLYCRPPVIVHWMGTSV